MVNAIKYIFGAYRPEEEISEVKKEIKKETLITQTKARQVNKILYAKDTTFFLAKGLGVLK